MLLALEISQEAVDFVMAPSVNFHNKTIKLSSPRKNEHSWRGRTLRLSYYQNLCCSLRRSKAINPQGTRTWKVNLSACQFLQVPGRQDDSLSTAVSTAASTEFPWNYTSATLTAWFPGSPIGGLKAQVGVLFLDFHECSSVWLDKVNILLASLHHETS